ncbi:MAG: septum site-determining protein MinC [Bacillota bacterium]|nr:septum site-determining protein MinC [Bacillota bacterium]
MKKRQNVIIKGTKEGLTLHLNDDCSFQELKDELDEKLSANERDHEKRPLIPVKLETGNRYLSEIQREELKSLVRQKKNLVVDEIESNVISKEEAEKTRRENEIISVARIIRSGQILEVQGDLLLFGDVNPGGKVIAGGNIFIMGALRGIAHAGCFGNKQAVIAASIMKPSQIRISDLINQTINRVRNDDNHEMECAYINHQEQIVVDRLQGLIHIRPDLTRLEGGR